MVYQTRTRAFLGIAMASTLTLTACGGSVGSNLINGLSITTSQNAGDVMVTVSTEINTGNLVFPMVTLPILDPNNPSTSYGSISVQRTLAGKNVLSANVDITKVSGAHGILDSSTLPNGTQIPVAGVANVIAFQAGSSSRVYMSLTDQTKMLGVAVAIKEFDAIGGYLPGANLFFDVPQTSGVSGIAGIFTGSQSGQSGIALFVDASAAINNILKPQSVGVSALASRTAKVSAAAAAPAPASSLSFVSGTNMSDSEKSSMEYQLYKLSRKNKKLTVR